MTDPDPAAIRQAYEEMHAVYERQASWWHERRSRSLYESAWLDAFIAALPAGGRVLDLGCGSGVPIGEYLRASGLRVSGMDYSAAMIEIAKTNFPNESWVVADMRQLGHTPQFDGILSWDAFFHLSVDEQRAVLPDLAARIRPGGAFMLTVGHGEGEVLGCVNGDCVYHASLSDAEYRAVLTASGFAQITFTPNDPDCLGRSVLLARHKMPTE